MTIQFFNADKQVKSKNLKIIPNRGDLISFVKNTYYCVVSIEHHYENDTIVIRLNEI